MFGPCLGRGCHLNLRIREASGVKALLFEDRGAGRRGLEAAGRRGKTFKSSRGVCMGQVGSALAIAGLREGASGGTENTKKDIAAESDVLTSRPARAVLPDSETPPTRRRRDAVNALAPTLLLNKHHSRAWRVADWDVDEARRCRCEVGVGHRQASGTRSSATGH